MQDKINNANTNHSEVELPQSIVDEFAQFLVPEIRKFYDSETGQREFTKWQAKQETDK